MEKKRVVEIIACLYILLFVYAAVTKLLDYDKFVVQIGQSPILTNWSGYIAWLVPAIELFISLLLIFPTTRLTGLYASVGLMVMFTTYIILASKFSDYVPCSCGGVLQDMTWGQHLVFNLFFLVSGVVAILIYPKRIATI